MIILIHGIGDSGAAMAPITNALIGQVPTFAPTRRPLPPSATFEDLIDDFLKQLDEAGTGPAFLLGYSFGGLIALTIAQRHPERVRGVIGLAAKVIYDARTMSHLRHIISVPHLSRIGPERIKAYEKRWGSDLPTLVQSAMKMYESFHTTPPLSDDDLRAIHVPVLLASGERDQVTSAAETRRLESLIPNSRVKFFPGEAHPMRSVPAGQVAQWVVDFVADVDAHRIGSTRPEEVAS